MVLSPLRTALCGAAGLAAFVLVWQWGAQAWGPFVLPQPAEALRSFGDLAATGQISAALALTGLQALAGWLAGIALGGLLGLAAGYVAALGAALRPVVLVVLGVPPIAWVVLALLWFGPQGLGPAFTVTVTTFPIVFAAALQGLSAQSAELAEMAALFRASPRLRFSDIVFPQLLDHLLPAAATALAFAWKVCVMAEVLGGGTGIGGRLAMARAHLDLPETMAWVLLIVALVLVCDLMFLAPARGWLARRRAPPSLSAPG